METQPQLDVENSGGRVAISLVPTFLRREEKKPILSDRIKQRINSEMTRLKAFACRHQASIATAVIAFILLRPVASYTTRLWHVVSETARRASAAVLGVLFAVDNTANNWSYETFRFVDANILGWFVPYSNALLYYSLDAADVALNWLWYTSLSAVNLGVAVFEVIDIVSTGVWHAAYHAGDFVYGWLDYWRFWSVSKIYTILFMFDGLANEGWFRTTDWTLGKVEALKGWLHGWDISFNRLLYKRISWWFEGESVVLEWYDWFSRWTMWTKIYDFADWVVVMSFQFDRSLNRLLYTKVSPWFETD